MTSLSGLNFKIRNKRNKSLENIQITQQMFDNLDYDTGSAEKAITSTNGGQPLGIFVFNQSDLNAAAYHFAQSLQDPLNAGAIKCAFVQESCVNKFKFILKSQLKPFSKEALENGKLASALSKSSEVIAKLNAMTLSQNVNSPQVVYDFPQEHFTADGPSPVVTLYTFRTVKEAIALSKKESALQAATIWCDNHATGYEVVVATSWSHYYLNCCNVDWTPIADYIEKGQTFVVMANSYHYETLIAAEKQKSIVFPFGTTFAN